MKFISTVFFLLFLWPLSLLAAGPVGGLDTYLAGFKELQGKFDQQILDNRGSAISKSTGEFYLQRPNQFRWDVMQPFHQLIITNGKKVWVYDEELEQLSINPIDASYGTTPAMLLSSTKPLYEDFRVTDLGEEKGLYWYELKPKGEETQFQQLRLGFMNGELFILQIEDSFGQYTHVHFSDIKKNQPQPAGLYEMKVPAGVDVVGSPD